MSTSDNISAAVVYLLRREPFYGELLLRVRRVYERGPRARVQTAGVAILPTGPVLAVNLDFWDRLAATPGLGVEAQAAVLVHEALHLLHLHPARTPDPSQHARWNQAADRAINQLIPGMGTPGWKAAGISPLFPLEGQEEKREAEYYYAHEKQDDGSGGGPLDDHDGWAEGGVSEDLARAMVSSVAKAAAKAAGSVPGGLEGVIDALDSPRLSWRALLRRFVARELSSRQVPTRSRRSRRWGLQQPGRRSEEQLRLAVAVDTSGSVSDDELAIFFGEVNAISGLGVDVILIQADAEVCSVEPWKKRLQIQVKGRGGTCYGPALGRAVEEGVDAVVYFGDMDAADTPSDPGIPTLWVSTGGARRPGPFGTLVQVSEAPTPGAPVDFRGPA